MIRDRLILVYTVPTVLLMGVLGLVIYLEARDSLENELGKRLTSVAQTVVGSLPGGDPRRLSKLEEEDESTIKRLQEKLETVRKVAGVRRVFLFDASHKSLVDTRNDVRFGQPLFDLEADRAELEEVFRGEGRSASSVLFTGEDDVPYKNGYAPIVYEGKVICAIGVEGSAEYLRVIADFRNVILSIGFLALVCIIAVSVMVARSMTRPIGVLVEASRRFGAGDLSEDVSMSRKDEFQTLTNAFNEMRGDLLARDRQLQMMLSGIAHEVRNPLGGMELFLGLLSEEIKDDPTSADYVDKISRELHSLGRVVNAFLDYARKNPLEWQRFDGAEFVQEIVQLLLWDLQGEGVELSVGSLGEGIEITADRERLHRILINLVRNAGQASPSGSHVKISVVAVDALEPRGLPGTEGRDTWWVVEPKVREGEKWRALIVQDEGRGIPAEKLEKIFEPFYTTKEKGSGLGLALMKKTVEAHGGTIAVSSNPRPVLQNDPQEEMLGGFEDRWIGEDGDEVWLGGQPEVQKTPVELGEDVPSGGYGTVMVIFLPFKEELERAAMDIPEGWLG